MTKTQKPKFIKPPNHLKSKVGSGGIDSKTIGNAQKQLEAAPIDFKPIAKAFLKTISEECSNPDFSENAAPFKTINAIMQLKANGGMFQYQLVSEVAEIALHFIENVDGYNQDTVDVIIAHKNTIEIIITNKLTGHGGKNGYALLQELNGACERYFKKHPKEEDEY